MTTNQERTNLARRAIMTGISAFSAAQGLCDGGFSTWLHGWKDYYFKAPDNAPKLCIICASGEGRFRFSEIRKGYYPA